MAADWGDLNTRVASGLAMAVVGISLIWIGGPWFLALAAIVSGLMLWELARMTSPQTPGIATQLAILGTLAVVVAQMLTGPAIVVMIALPALVGAALLKQNRAMFAVYALGVVAAGYALTLFRDSYGLTWMIWLVLVVIATDVFGYFAGRMLGGPKFWPAISPKKTWSGTVAGWVSAAVVGLIFHALTGAGIALAAVSALLSFASQMGDIAESAIKRRMGVKDSSALIPGHGGLLDRFDGLLGAAVVMLIVALLGFAPHVRF